MNVLGDPQTTNQIRTDWEISVEMYLNWQLGCIDDLNCQFGNCWVSTQIQTRSDSLEQLQRLSVVSELLAIDICGNPVMDFVEAMDVKKIPLWYGMQV